VRLERQLNVAIQAEQSERRRTRNDAARRAAEEARRRTRRPELIRRLSDQRYNFGAYEFNTSMYNGGSEVPLGDVLRQVASENGEIVAFRFMFEYESGRSSTRLIEWAGDIPETFEEVARNYQDSNAIGSLMLGAPGTIWINAVGTPMESGSACSRLAQVPEYLRQQKQNM